MVFIIGLTFFHKKVVMATIFGRTRPIGGEGFLRIISPSFMRYFGNCVHTHASGRTTLKTVKEAEKTFISPQLRRDLLEDMYRAEQPKQYTFDGFPEPEDQLYEAMMRTIFEDLKKYQKLQ